MRAVLLASLRTQITAASRAGRVVGARLPTSSASWRIGQAP
jgi:hypothetical protein